MRFVTIFYLIFVTPLCWGEYLAYSVSDDGRKALPENIRPRKKAICTGRYKAAPMNPEGRITSSGRYTEASCTTLYPIRRPTLEN